MLRRHGQANQAPDRTDLSCLPRPPCREQRQRSRGTGEPDGASPSPPSTRHGRGDGGALRDRAPERVDQRLFHVGGTREPRLGIPVARALDDADDRRRQTGPRGLERDAGPRRMRRSQLLHVGGKERIRSRQQPVEEDAERIDIAAHRRRAAAGEHLRRHVHRGSGLVAGGLARGRRPSGAEIHQHHPPATLAENIARLDVAVQQSGGVDGRQGAGHVNADEQRLLGAEHAVARQDLVERLSFEQFHPDAAGAIVLVGAEDADDMRMIESSEESAFRQRVRRLHGIGREQFERDFARQLRVPGAIDGAARAAADFAADLEVAPARRDRTIRRDIGAENRRPVRARNRVDDAERLWDRVRQRHAVEQRLDGALDVFVSRHRAASRRAAGAAPVQ